jgi:hypothetical protein
MMRRPSAHCYVLLCCLQVDAALSQLRDALREEVRLQETLLELSGCLEPILAAALVSGVSVA